MAQRRSAWNDTRKCSHDYDEPHVSESTPCLAHEPMDVSDAGVARFVDFGTQFTRGCLMSRAEDEREREFLERATGYDRHYPTHARVWCVCVSSPPLPQFLPASFP